MKKGNNKYINVQCPHCKTIHVVRREQRHEVILCGCNKRFVLVECNGKYEAEEA